MRTRCEACGRVWGAEEPLGLKAESTVTACAMCDVFRSKLEERLRSGPPKPTEALSARLGKLLPANVYADDSFCSTLEVVPPEQPRTYRYHEALSNLWEVPCFVRDGPALPKPGVFPPCPMCGRADTRGGLDCHDVMLMTEDQAAQYVSTGLFNKPMQAEYASAKPQDLEALREAREKLGRTALGAVVYVRQETLDELKRLPPARADHITPMHALAHSFERIEVRVWDEKRLGPITDEELARINDLLERGVLKA